MAATLLSIVQQACARMAGLSVPTSIVDNPDPIVVTMLALANEEGEDLMRAHEWSALTVEGAFLTLATGQESYPLPADFDRLVGRTTWDRSVRWPMQGPDSPQMARARRESILPSTAFRRSFRQSGSNLTIWPVPATSGDVIAFDYVSSFWAASATGTPQAGFQADTGVPLLPAHLFILGLKWRWLEAQNMGSDGAQARYGDQRRRAIAHDRGGGRVVDMGSSWDRPEGNCDDVVAGGPQVVLGTSNGASIAVD